MSSGRGLSMRLGVATIDQGLASLSRFAVAAAIARVAGLKAFGAYALVYACWIVLAGFHRSLVTDPMSIENDVHADDAAHRIRLGLSGELAIGMAAGALAVATGFVLLLVHQHTYGIGFVAIAPWFPFMVVQDYWRWIGFMKAQPQKALVNDILLNVVQVVVFAALYLTDVRSSLLAIVSWGAGALAGAFYGLWQFRTVPSLRGGIKQMLHRWPYSKWLVANNLVASATVQATVVLSGALLGPAGLGGLKAALNLVVGPPMVLVQAAGSVGLPEAAKQLSQYGWPGLRRIQRLIGALSVVTVLVVTIAILIGGRQLLVLIYGPAFGKFATVADICAISFLITAFYHGGILCLKVTKQTRLQIPVIAASLVVSVVSIATLVPAFGVIGAAWANLIGNVTRTAGILIAHWISSRRTAEAMVPNPEPLPPIRGLHREPPVRAIPAPGPVNSSGAPRPTVRIAAFAPIDPTARPIRSPGHPVRVAAFAPIDPTARPITHRDRHRVDSNGLALNDHDSALNGDDDQDAGPPVWEVEAVRATREVASE